MMEALGAVLCHSDLRPLLRLRRCVRGINLIDVRRIGLLEIGHPRLVMVERCCRNVGPLRERSAFLDQIGQRQRCALRGVADEKNGVTIQPHRRLKGVQSVGQQGERVAVLGTKQLLLHLQLMSLGVQGELLLPRIEWEPLVARRSLCAPFTWKTPWTDRSRNSIKALGSLPAAAFMAWWSFFPWRTRLPCHPGWPATPWRTLRTSLETRTVLDISWWTFLLTAVCPRKLGRVHKSDVCRARCIFRGGSVLTLLGTHSCLELPVGSNLHAPLLRHLLTADDRTPWGGLGAISRIITLRFGTCCHPENEEAKRRGEEEQAEETTSHWLDHTPTKLTPQRDEAPMLPRGPRPKPFGLNLMA
mmetsp:Transcript_4110/g.11574  ORF Transcript_4110/g.11574 Transcript_4110/m.11574 type:complete len:359 (+) Transcript_4110:322-1398(+)